MQVKVKGYLTFRDAIGDKNIVEVDAENVTLRDLLLKLSQDPKTRDVLYNLKTQDLRQHIAIVVNGSHYSHLPNRLDTMLKDGDEVAIFPPIAGG